MSNMQHTIDLAAKISKRRDLAFQRGELTPPVWSATADGGDHDEAAAVAAYQDATGDEVKLKEADVSLVHWSNVWFHHGLPRFDLTYHAATAFALADATDVCFDEVRMPYPAFMIQIPSPSPLRMKSARGGFTDVLQIRVLREFRHVSDELSKRNHALVDIAFERPLTPEETAELETIRKQQVVAFCFLVCGADDSIIRTRSAAFHGGDSLGDRLFNQILYDLDTEGDADKLDVAAIRVATSMVVNTVLWLQEIGYSPRPQRPLFNPRKVSKNDSGYRPVIYTVGTQIFLNDLKKLRDQARELAEGGEQSPGWAHKARYSVRGHWKSQPFGPGRLERKRIFVKPYWRGPEAGEALMKTYKVGR